MKILFLTRLYYPHVGGVEKHIAEISKILRKKGHIVVIISEDSINQIKNFDYPNWLKKFKIWWWLWKHRDLIDEADIIHAHDVAFWYFPFRFLYPKKPFFITFHGWEGKYPLPLKNKIIRKISEKLAWGNICVGSYIKKWYGTKPDYITYGGVMPPLPESPSVAPEVSLPLVFIGRLKEDTGLPIYLKSCKILNIKYQMLFLGDGELRKEAEKYGQVLGFVKDVWPYVLKSRFVLASGYLSILEALICRRLVFAVFENPLKKDYLKMAPFADWIIIEKNPKKIAEKIKYYLKHLKEEEKLIEKAYNWARKQTWKKVASLYLKLWKKGFYGK